MALLNSLSSSRPNQLTSNTRLSPLAGKIRLTPQESQRLAPTPGYVPPQMNLPDSPLSKAVGGLFTGTAQTFQTVFGGGLSRSLQPKIDTAISNQAQSAQKLIQLARQTKDPARKSKLLKAAQGFSQNLPQAAGVTSNLLASQNINRDTASPLGIAQQAMGFATEAPLAASAALTKGAGVMFGKSAALGGAIGGGVAAFTGGDVGEGIVGGAISGIKNAPTDALTNKVVEGLAKSLPFLKPLTEGAISAAKPISSMTFRQGLGALGTVALKRVLKAALIETPYETVYYGIKDRKEGEQLLDSMAREFQQNMMFNVGFAGVNTALDAYTVGQITKKSIEDTLSKPEYQLNNKGGVEFDAKVLENANNVDHSKNPEILAQYGEGLGRRVGELLNEVEQISKSGNSDTALARLKEIKSELPTDYKLQADAAIDGMRKSLGVAPATIYPAKPETPKTLEEAMGGKLTESKGQPQDQPLAPGTKEKKLVTRMKGSERFGETAQSLEGNYVPITNKETIAEAQRLVKLDPVAAEARAMNPQSAVDQAVGAELFSHYMDAGNVVKAKEVLNATSGTNEGQMIQILSKYDQTTPAGASKLANSEIERYNKSHPTKPIELDEKTMKEIYADAGKIQTMEQGRERSIAESELSKKIQNLIPSSIVDKFITIWKAGLLTSFRTHERNLIGTSVMEASEIIKDIPAALTDMLLSQKTGERTMTATLGGLGSGTVTGIQAAKDAVVLGYDPTNMIEKFDIHHVTWGNNSVEQALKKYTGIVFNTLSAEDKVFWGSVYARSLNDQAGAAALNVGKPGDAKFVQKLVNEPTLEMKNTATVDANYATFHDNNLLSGAVTNLKRGMSQNELGKLVAELTMPFTGVPTSIAGKMVDYSPIGLAKGIWDSGKVLTSDIPGLQRQASQEIGRGVVGSAIFALGAYLTSKGIITGTPKDPEERRQWELEGKQQNSILVGGKWRSINSIGPQTIVLLAGSKAYDDMQEGGGGIGKFGADVARDFTNQTFLAGVQGPLNAISDPNRYSEGYFKSQASSIIPNIVKDTSKSLDPYARETNSVSDALQASIPLLRNKLIPRRDALGQVLPQVPTGLPAFFDLFNSTTPVKSVVVGELSRLNEAGINTVPSKIGSSQTINGFKRELTPKELDSYETMVGALAERPLEQLIASQGYQQMVDEDKSKAIDDLMTAARATARDNMGKDLKAVGGIVTDTVTSSTSSDPKIQKILFENSDTPAEYIDGRLYYREGGDVKSINLKALQDLPSNTTPLQSAQFSKDIKSAAKSILTNSQVYNPQSSITSQMAYKLIQSINYDPNEAYFDTIGPSSGLEFRSAAVGPMITKQGANSIPLIQELIKRNIFSTGLIEQLYTDGYVDFNTAKILTAYRKDYRKQLEAGDSTSTASQKGLKTPKLKIPVGVFRSKNVSIPRLRGANVNSIIKPITSPGMKRVNLSV